MIRVRATINLPGLPAGQEAMADAEDPDIKACLEATYLVVVDNGGDDDADG